MPTNKKKLKHIIKNILIDKNKLAYAVVMAVLIITIITETIIIFRSDNVSNNTSQTLSVPNKAQADRLKALAIGALKKNNIAQAKALFQEAKQQYEDLGDTNNVVDTEAQLYLIEHPGTPE